MKKTSILLSIAGVFLYLILSSYSSGPGSSGLELTGVTGTTGCGGAGCHPSATATPALTVWATLETVGGMPVTTYTPGGTYYLHLHGVNGSSYNLPKFGYQATARLTSPINAGIMIAPVGSHLDTVSGVAIVEHSAPLSGVGSGGTGTTYDVYVKWIAAYVSGPVKFRSVMLAATDSAGTTPMDMWNSGPDLVINEGPPMAGIIGQPHVCEGSTTTLTDATPYGSWSSANPSVATVGILNGVVTGVAAGVTTITYTAAGLNAMTIVTVNPNPAPITAAAWPAWTCIGGNTTFTDATPGGYWSSADPSVAIIGSASGMITGTGIGASMISYILPEGCYAANVINVNPMPTMFGTLNLCVGGTTTLFGTSPSGSWSSSAPGIANVDTSGVVTGTTAGVATITYATTPECAATKTVTVSTIPSAAIGGTLTVCEGATTTLTGTPSGGTWVCTTIGTANVGPSGIVSGFSGGTTTILYIASNSCGADTASTPLLVIPAIICEMGVNGATSAQKSIAVYPNPSNGQCSITTSLAQTGVVSMRLVNALGQVVSQWQMSASGTHQVQLPAIPGVYILSADAEKLHFTEKIVVE